MVKQGKRYIGLSRQLIGIIIAISTLFTVIVTGLSYMLSTKIAFLTSALKLTK